MTSKNGGPTYSKIGTQMRRERRSNRKNKTHISSRQKKIKGREKLAHAEYRLIHLSLLR